MKTRQEMIRDYGAPPPSFTTRWTIHRSHASVTWVTEDGGQTWERKRILYAPERARREEQALEMAAIQRTLK